MSLTDLPDGCLQHVLHFLDVRDVATGALTCKRFSTLAKLPLMWISRLKEDFGVAIKVGLGNSLSFHVVDPALETVSEPC